MTQRMESLRTTKINEIKQNLLHAVGAFANCSKTLLEKKIIITAKNKKIKNNKFDIQ
jgi:hypothetical protein